MYYRLIPFPEIQKYQEREDFYDNSFPQEDGGAFVREEWLDSLDGVGIPKGHIISKSDRIRMPVPQDCSCRVTEVSHTEHPFLDLYKQHLALYKRMAAELAATQHRPAGWLPRTVFVESDEYENGFVKYEVREIHPDQTFTGMNHETGKEERLDLNEINIDFLMLLMDLYVDMCLVQNLEDEDIRRCDKCGMPMKEGYYLAGEYACSDMCCLSLYAGDKLAMYEDLKNASADSSDCYYTEWESYSTEY